MSTGVVAIVSALFVAFAFIALHAAFRVADTDFQGLPEPTAHPLNQYVSAHRHSAPAPMTVNGAHPTIPRTVRPVSADDASKSCPICLVSGRRQVVAIPCGHVMCNVCGRLIAEDSCPICRSPITHMNALFL